MFLGILRFLATGWIEKMYGEPHFFFAYPGFDWVRPWPVWGMYLHYSVLAVLALAIALGAFHRIATLLFVIGFAYTQLIDVTNYLNHHYLVVLLGMLLAWLPANALWSIDVWRDPQLRRATISAWMVWLLRFQVGVVYVFAGLAKAKVDWLLGGQPLNLWLAARTETPIVGPLLDEPRVALAMAWAGFLFDTTIVAWLSWRRTRLVAYVVLIAFHGFTGYLFNIGMFPLIMTSAALIFFPPSWPRRFRRGDGVNLVHLSQPKVDKVDTVPRVTSAKVDKVDTVPRMIVPRVTRIIIAIHVVLQLALPLRHHLYPGDVLWNEDGMRFAWHVMIREKHGSAMFEARFADGRRLEIPPSNYLTWRQEREMGAQPDLILQLAHHIGDDLHAKGYRGFTLHANTRVSLNGRSPEPLIDPAVNLLAIRDLGPRTWVLGAPASVVPHVMPLR
ncbi:MAG: HTTM domain-containing protein [Deltaproteobacteria bacterium]|nr:HTTM domain-containing protein [Deltaproteobacteria bacterium]